MWGKKASHPHCTRCCLCVCYWQLLENMYTGNTRLSKPFLVFLSSHKRRIRKDTPADATKTPPSAVKLPSCCTKTSEPEGSPPPMENEMSCALSFLCDWLIVMRSYVCRAQAPYRANSMHNANKSHGAPQKNEPPKSYSLNGVHTFIFTCSSIVTMVYYYDKFGSIHEHSLPKLRTLYPL